jgi:nitroreductase
MFMQDGSTGYQHACAAAVQNMQLAAHALGLGSLWFTLFDKAAISDILAIDENLVPLALVCLGRPAGDMPPVPRKAIEKLTTYLR